MSFRGTLTLTDDTLKAVVTDIVDSLVKTGFRTIIITSTHGGNYVLWSDFISQLDKTQPNATVLMANLQRAWDEAYKAAGFKTSGMHADECEASLIGSLRPDLIGSNPTDFPSPKDQLKGVPIDRAGFPLDVREVSPSGALGEPSKGKREKGNLFWSVFLKRAVKDVKKQAGL